MIKRNSLLLLSVLNFAMMIPSAQAWHWIDLWQNKNQQGMQALRKGDPRKAAETFLEPAWKGVAYYRSHDYEKAMQQFSLKPDATNLYNQANALAHLQRYEDAIATYDKALALQKDFPDAVYNRDLLKKLLQQQEQQKQQKQQQSQANNKQQNNDKQQQQNAQNQQAADQNTQQQQTQQQAANQQANKMDQKPTTEKQNVPGQMDQKQQANSTQATDNAKQAEHESKPEQNASQKEQQQAMNQALKRVPDEPGNLLQRTFTRDYNRRHGVAEIAEEQNPWQ
jgi:Ca-activated chloride channel family protein